MCNNHIKLYIYIYLQNLIIVHVNIIDETDKMKLLKWKMEQETKKKEQKLQKKLPFIVGTVHHSFYSPIKTTKNSSAIIKKRIVQTQKKFNNTKQAEITRAREKKLLIDFPAVPFKTPLFEEVCVKR